MSAITTKGASVTQGASTATQASANTKGSQHRQIPAPRLPRWLVHFGLAALLLGLLTSGCECGDVIVRGCKTNMDCVDSAPEIYCFEQKCSTFQCNPKSSEECDDSPPQNKNKGICKGGIRTCLETGLWSSCVGQVLARAELCDRLDNDCNGKVDDGLHCDCAPGSKQQCYNGPSNTFGKGECKAGIQFCESDNKWGRCLEQTMPFQEQCDKLDNDCNGQIDDGINCECEPGKSRSCYPTGIGCTRKSDGTYQCKGLCKQGKQFCSDRRKWGGCNDVVVPIPETCNGKDDNCDGQIDEVYPEWGRVCILDDKNGPCREGTTTCIDGKLACAQTYKIVDEICGNGQDDNCDGTINESPPCKCKPGTSQVCYSLGVGCKIQKDGTYKCKPGCNTGLLNCKADQTWTACIGESGPKDEVCDGKDNNCDGLVDEPWANVGKTCQAGLGACQKSGVYVCKADGTDIQCDATPGAPKLEVCDGKDNDCDGKVDEEITQVCYTGPKDTAGRGECRRGTQACERGAWATCKDEVTPRKELCNGKDENCDGKVDEDFPNIGQPCFAGLGDCRAEGVYTCSKDGTKASCATTMPGKSSAEVCDGKDNDCDGQIDENFPNKGKSCASGQGACQKTGTYTCTSDGVGTACNAVSGTPSAETCDGKDNDCDGQTDEDLTRDCYTGGTATSDVGECKQGIQSCVGGSWGTCTGEVTPKTELCDQKDNDCDGLFDETCGCTQGNTQACGSPVGSCQQGIQTCESNRTWGVCVGEVSPKAETCDGLDNDCDGQTDENLAQSCYTGASGSAGKGLCRQGTQICKSGAWGACTGEVTPKTEICDGKDNDCDGQIDETWSQLGQSCKVGTGECQQTGKFTCNTDGASTICDAAAATPQAEVCDNKDNNCNGSIDEGLSKSCYSGTTNTRGVGECKQGTQTCSAGTWSGCAGEVTPKAEICDGKDNDCNGQADETCQCQGTQTQACGNTTGECQAGIQTCQNGSWGPCMGSTPSSAETCDDKDNDCDGLIDEDFTQKGAVCQSGVGECQTQGLFKCLGDGSGVICGAVPKPPQSETCDKKDNDCDGAIDEDFTTLGQSCTRGVGECNNTGIFRCRANGNSVRCNATVLPPTTEVCDNKDNDCDGQTDEGLTKKCYTGPKKTKKKGLCKEGTTTCGYGQWGPCVGEILPQIEICGDGLDNNCDKKSDEGCGSCSNGSTQSCGSGTGACVQGTQTCASNKWGACSGLSNPSTEYCNGTDDDCDGSIDEEFPTKGQACSAGIGECQRNGVLICHPAGLRVYCDKTPGTPTAEVCDGKDNNCNGQVDEGCP